MDRVNELVGKPFCSELRVGAEVRDEEVRNLLSASVKFDHACCCYLGRFCHYEDKKIIRALFKQA